MKRVTSVVVALLSTLAGCQSNVVNYDVSQKYSALAGHCFVLREQVFLSTVPIYARYELGVPGNWPEFPNSVAAYYASPASDWTKIAGVLGPGTHIKVTKIFENPIDTAFTWHVVGQFTSGPFEDRTVLIDAILKWEGKEWRVDDRFLQPCDKTD